MVTREQVQEVIETQELTYGDTARLLAEIDNPYFDSTDSFYDRYTVEEDGEYSYEDMRFVIEVSEDGALGFYSESDIHPGSIVYDIVGDITEVSGEAVYGYIQLFDAVIMGTVDRRAISRNRYVRALLELEGLPQIAQDRSRATWYFPPESNPELEGTELEGLWVISDITAMSVRSRGALTGSQMFAAYEHQLLGAIPEATLTSLNWIEFETDVNPEDPDAPEDDPTIELLRYRISEALDAPVELRSVGYEVQFEVDLTRDDIESSVLSAASDIVEVRGSHVKAYISVEDPDDFRVARVSIWAMK